MYPELIALFVWLHIISDMQYAKSVLPIINSKYCTVRIDLQHPENVIKTCWEPSLEELLNDQTVFQFDFDLTMNILLNALQSWIIWLSLSHCLVLLSGLAIGYAFGLTSRLYLEPEALFTPDKSDRIKGKNIEYQSSL